MQNLAALWNCGVAFGDLSAEQRERVTGHRPDAFVRVCTFHPSYGYEDFIEGFRPTTTEETLGFAVQNGIFKTLCRTASKDPAGRYYLIVDEINRGDVPRIFGELLTLLDKPKRGSAVLLPLSGDRFVGARERVHRRYDEHRGSLDCLARHRLASGFRLHRADA